jgi:hypothetical protein
MDKKRSKKVTSTANISEGADYVQLYLEGMEKAGFGSSNSYKLRFEKYYHEFLNDENYGSSTKKNSIDARKYCAIIAQLKTAHWIGFCTNEAYDIREFYGLTNEELIFVKNNGPQELIKFVNWRKYGIE